MIQKHAKLLQNHDKIFRNLLNQQAFSKSHSMPQKSPENKSPENKSPEKIILPAPSAPTVEIIETELKEELEELEKADLKNQQQESKKDG